ncbi:uncharacterized protein BP5553_09182 [Venustampulla echinocandica]|uniref:3'-5' exoribonuclease Rv2179c-like domain-containing protein n=1 Tax=Venustampulla echinocandica TaxID=2656787 RepID=A0A370TC01_9HELO|nr:uncharacterized protein BP5553_09182 [Venustampulla echinocandica]RDL31780.1 hypothetical protein BP5553_09182 [Venustampulla echinocandica]
MKQKNFHTNIMLDLECADPNVYNPVLLELGAVYFDIDTGKELGHLITPISYQSCLDLGFVTKPETLSWLEKTIPETLETSKTTSVTLAHALFKLSKFIRSCCKATKQQLRDVGREFHRQESEPMIWGNGVLADNLWIQTAYSSCSMEKPWAYYNNMCVRTVVKQCAFMTGRDYSREVKQKGTKHYALDDCRHQIVYLVKARNSLMPASKKRSSSILSPQTSFSISEGGDEESQLTQRLPSPKRNTAMPISPETSFSICESGQEEFQRSHDLSTLDSDFSEQKKLPTLPISPETSFSISNDGETGFHGVNDILDPDLPVIAVGSERHPIKSRAAMLITPETSFSISDDGRDQS